MTRRFWGKATPKPLANGKCLALALPRTDAEATTATIRMYGPIDSYGGVWGVSAAEVSDALDALPESINHIQLRVNSPGGEGFEGLAILNMLRAHPATVTAVVDGLAASAASFIVTGCDNVVMSPGTQMMIHDAWGLAIGNPAEMRAAATFLDSVSNGIAEIYAEAAGGNVADWRALMGAETWYTAQEAVSAGLANAVDVVPDKGVTSTAGAEPAEPAAQADPFEDRFDLSMYAYAGREHAPDPVPVVVVAEGTTPDVDTASPADLTAEDAAANATAPDAAESTDDAEALLALASVTESAAVFAFGV